MSLLVSFDLSKYKRTIFCGADKVHPAVKNPELGQFNCTQVHLLVNPSGLSDNGINFSFILAYF